MHNLVPAPIKKRKKIEKDGSEKGEICIINSESDRDHVMNLKADKQITAQTDAEK